MVFLAVYVVSFIVSIVLNLLTYHNNEKKKTSSLKKFIVRAPFDFITIGSIGMATPIIAMIPILTYPGIKEMAGVPIFDLGTRWNIFVQNSDSFILLFALFYALSFPLMVAPIKGVWDVIVDNDDITVVKAFIFKRHWKFSEIEYCRTTRGGIKAYVKGRRRKAFFVDAMVEGSGNFRRRVEKEGIPIYHLKEKRRS